MSGGNTFVMYLSLIVYTFVLIWGLKLVKSAFSEPGTVLKLLSEENPSSAPATEQEVQQQAQQELATPPKPSFSRLSGAVGSMGLAAIFIAIGYWVIYALFNGKNLSDLDGLGIYFLSGSAIFAPYAFNQLGKVFK